MTEVQKYWRDRLMSLLILGGGFFLVMLGWSISEAHLFTLVSSESKSGTIAEFYRAVGLIAIVSFFSFVWLFSIRWIYFNHLRGDVDATVLPPKIVYSYAISLVLILIIVTYFICL